MNREKLIREMIQIELLYQTRQRLKNEKNSFFLRETTETTETSGNNNSNTTNPTTTAATTAAKSSNKINFDSFFQKDKSSICGSVEDLYDKITEVNASNSRQMNPDFENAIKAFYNKKGLKESQCISIYDGIKAGIIGKNNEKNEFSKCKEYLESLYSFPFNSINDCDDQSINDLLNALNDQNFIKFVNEGQNNVTNKTWKTFHADIFNNTAKPDHPMGPGKGEFLLLSIIKNVKSGGSTQHDIIFTDNSNKEVAELEVKQGQIAKQKDENINAFRFNINVKRNTDTFKKRSEFLSSLNKFYDNFIKSTQKINEMLDVTGLYESEYIKRNFIKDDSYSDTSLSLFNYLTSNNSSSSSSEEDDEDSTDDSTKIQKFPLGLVFGYLSKHAVALKNDQTTDLNVHLKQSGTTASRNAYNKIKSQLDLEKNNAINDFINDVSRDNRTFTDANGTQITIDKDNISSDLIDKWYVSIVTPITDKKDKTSKFGNYQFSLNSINSKNPLKRLKDLLEMTPDNYNVPSDIFGSDNLDQYNKKLGFSDIKNQENIYKDILQGIQNCDPSDYDNFKIIFGIDPAAKDSAGKSISDLATINIKYSDEQGELDENNYNSLGTLFRAIKNKVNEENPFLNTGYKNSASAVSLNLWIHSYFEKIVDKYKALLGFYKNMLDEISNAKESDPIKSVEIQKTVNLFMNKDKKAEDWTKWDLFLDVYRGLEIGHKEVAIDFKYYDEDGKLKSKKNIVNIADEEFKITSDNMSIDKFFNEVGDEQGNDIINLQIKNEEISEDDFENIMKTKEAFKFLNNFTSSTTTNAITEFIKKRSNLIYEMSAESKKDATAKKQQDIAESNKNIIQYIDELIEKLINLQTAIYKDYVDISNQASANTTQRLGLIFVATDNKGNIIKFSLPFDKRKKIDYSQLNDYKTISTMIEKSKAETNPGPDVVLIKDIYPNEKILFVNSHGSTDTSQTSLLEVLLKLKDNVTVQMTQISNFISEIKNLINQIKSGKNIKRLSSSDYIQSSFKNQKATRDAAATIVNNVAGSV